MSSLFRPFTSRPLCSLLAVTALSAAAIAQTPVPGGNPANPQLYDTPTAAPHAAFMAVAAALKPPTPTVVRANYAEFCAQYSVGFQTAANAMATLRLQLGQIANTQGASANLALATADAVHQIEIGFAGISADFSDNDISSQLSFWYAADGFIQLATLLPNVHGTFADTVVPAQGAANALTGIITAMSGQAADPFDGLFTNLFALHGAQQDLVEALVPEPVEPPPFTAAGGCPPGMFRGCTNYHVVTYSGVSCGAWKRLVGGLSIGVGEGVTVGTTICPDGGLWKRTCTMQACTTETCECECYESRWDRFWAINGTGHTTTVTNLGCVTESFTEYEWECDGPPSSAAPSAPGRDISMGDTMNC